MLWIVIDQHPKPDKYIPIIAKKNKSSIDLKIDPKDFKVFDNFKEAVSFALQLKLKFKVKTIRVFYADGNSKAIK